MPRWHGVTALVMQNRDADARQTRNQRFVDAAADRGQRVQPRRTPSTSVNGSSTAPVGRATRHAERQQQRGQPQRLFGPPATSEAVVNGAALEGIDNRDNASVLVSVRVTVRRYRRRQQAVHAYRLRVIVR